MNELIKQLCILAKNNDVNGMRQFLNDNKTIDVNTPYQQGYTAMYYACKHLSIDCAKILLACGAQLDITAHNAKYSLRNILAQHNPSLLDQLRIYTRNISILHTSNHHLDAIEIEDALHSLVKATIYLRLKDMHTLLSKHANYLHSKTSEILTLINQMFPDLAVQQEIYHHYFTNAVNINLNILKYLRKNLPSIYQSSLAMLKATTYGELTVGIPGIQDVSVENVTDIVQILVELKATAHQHDYNMCFKRFCVTKYKNHSNLLHVILINLQCILPAKLVIEFIAEEKLPYMADNDVPIIFDFLYNNYSQDDFRLILQSYITLSPTQAITPYVIMRNIIRKYGVECLSIENTHKLMKFLLEYTFTTKASNAENIRFFLEHYPRETQKTLFDQYIDSMCAINISVLSHILVTHPNLFDRIKERIKAMRSSKQIPLIAMYISSIKHRNSYPVLCKALQLIIHLLQLNDRYGTSILGFALCVQHDSNLQYSYDIYHMLNLFFEKLEIVMPVELVCQLVKYTFFFDESILNIPRWVQFVVQNYTELQRIKIAESYIQKDPYGATGLLLNLSRQAECDLMVKYRHYRNNFWAMEPTDDSNLKNSNRLAMFTDNQVCQIAHGFGELFNFSWLEPSIRSYTDESLCKIVEAVFVKANGFIPAKFFYKLPINKRIELSLAAIRDSIDSALSAPCIFNEQELQQQSDLENYGLLSKFHYKSLQNYLLEGHNHELEKQMIIERIQILSRLASQQHSYQALNSILDKATNYANANGADNNFVVQIYAWIHYIVLMLGNINASNRIIDLNSNVLEQIYRYKDTRGRLDMTDYYLLCYLDAPWRDNVATLNSTNICKHTLLPSILLGKVYKTPPGTDKRNNILQYISSEYKDINKLPYLINGMLSILNDKNIADDKKFILILRILRPSTIEFFDNTTENNAKKIAAQKISWNKPQRNFLLFRDTDTIYLAGKNYLGVPFFAEVGKTKSLHALHTLLLRQKHNRVELHSVIKKGSLLGEILKLKCIGLDVDYSIMLWNCVYGLAGYNKLGLLMQQGFTHAFYSTIAEQFALNEEQKQHFVKNFMHHNNYTLLLTYHAALMKLRNPDERSTYIGLLQTYIQLASSKNNGEDFYKFRYNEELNKHLKNIFTQSEQQHLRAMWTQGHATSLAKLYDMYNLENADAFFDTKHEYIKQTIMHAVMHDHISAVKHDKKFKRAIRGSHASRLRLKTLIKDELKAIPMEFQLLPQISDLRLKINILELFDGNELDIKSKLNLVNKIEIGIQDAVEISIEFYRNLLAIKHALKYLLSRDMQNKKHENKPIDLNAYKVIDTDNHWSLLTCGTVVPDSCQSVTCDPDKNKSLIGGYVLSGHVRELAIIGSNNVLVARAILRILWDAVDKKPVLLIETIYPQTARMEFKLALYAFAIERARIMGCTLLGVPLGMFRNITKYPHNISVDFLYGAEYVDAMHAQCIGGYELSDGLPILFSMDNYVKQMQIMQQALLNKWGPRQLFMKTEFERVVQVVQP